MRGVAAVALVIAVVPSIVAAPADRIYPGGWESCRIGGGGWLQHAAWSPADAKRIYLGTDVGGLYRSDDGGRSWHMLNGALEPVLYGVRDVVAHPTDCDTFLIAAGDGYSARSGVWRSDDAGKSFGQVLAGEFYGNESTRRWGDVLVSAPDGSETVYACPPAKGLFRSDDFGKTWRSLGLTNVFARGVVVDRCDRRRIWVVGDVRKPGSKWACCRAGLFLTEDGGGSWRVVNGGDYPDEFVQDPRDAGLLHGAFRTGVLLRWSQDAGATWQPYENPEIHPEPTDSFHDGKCQALATGPDFVIAGCTAGNVYRLECGTKRWRKVEIAGRDFGDWYAATAPGFHPFGACLGWIGVSPHDPKNWMFTDWYGLYQTRDEGRNWKLDIDGIEMTVLHALAADPTNPKRIICGMADVGAFLSDDGVNFSKWKRGAVHDNIKCIAVAPSDGRTVYALGPKGYGWRSDALNVSGDGGETWRRPALAGLSDYMKNAPKAVAFNTVAVCPQSPKRVSLAVSGQCGPGAGGVWTSDDGGETLVWDGGGLPAVPFFAKDIWSGGAEIATDAAGGMVAVSAACSGAGYCRLPGEGKWRRAVLPGKGGRVVSDPAIPGRFYAGRGDAGLFRTDDSGLTWRRIAPGPIRGVCTDLARKDRVAFSGAGKCCWSADGGETWHVFDRPPRVGGILCLTESHLYMGTGGSGVFRIALNRAEGRMTDFQSQIDAVAKVGGGRVMVPSGRWQSGPLVLRDGVDLHLSRGSCLMADVTEMRRIAKRQGRQLRTANGLFENAQSLAFVSAQGATNVTLSGEGVLDGCGDQAIPYVNNRPGRWKLVRISDSKDIRIEGITMTNSASWTCYLQRCDGVVVRNVKIDGHGNYNNDGIDLEARNVLIENCEIDTVDDCICGKTHASGYVSENVVVRNCRLASNCNAFKLGTASSGTFRNWRVSGLDIRRSRAACFCDLTWQQRGIPGVTNEITGLAAIALEAVDGGSVRDVRISDVTIRDGFQTPFFLRVGSRGGDDRDDSFENVTIERVKGASESWIASSVTGVPGRRIRDVTFHDIELVVLCGAPRKLWDRPVPEASGDYPENRMFGTPLPAYGFYLRHADDLRFDRVRFSRQGTDERPAFVQDDCRDCKFVDSGATSCTVR